MTKTQRPTRHPVCPADELPPGSRKIVSVGGRSIGIFNVDGRLYALRNNCPHQGAPLCLGPISGTTLPGPVGSFTYGRDGEIIRCPWHGWEFDLTSGKSVFNPHRVRVRSYQVAIEEAPGGTADDPMDRDDPRLREDPSVETFPVRVERKMVVVWA